MGEILLFFSRCFLIVCKKILFGSRTAGYPRIHIMLLNNSNQSSLILIFMQDSDKILKYTIKVPIRNWIGRTDTRTEGQKPPIGYYIPLRKHAYSNILKKLPPKKWKFSDKKLWYSFYISAQNIDCGYSLEPPRRGGSKSTTIYVLSWNKKK